MHKHPGGFEIMKLVAGRDCTELIPMYHPFSMKTRASPLNYLKGHEVSPAERPIVDTCVTAPSPPPRSAS